MQVDLPKPLGLKFARGADGGAYIVTNDPKIGNTDPRIQVSAQLCLECCAESSTSIAIASIVHYWPEQYMPGLHGSVL